MKKMAMFAPLAILGILVFGFLGGGVVKLLWNWLAPPLFGWHEITFWQAFGLLALCRILFGGHTFGRAGSRSRWNAEEKARFRQRMRERCGFDPSTGEGPSTGASAGQ
jgi:hypothetical protein